MKFSKKLVALGVGVALIGAVAVGQAAASNPSDPTSPYEVRSTSDSKWNSTTTDTYQTVNVECANASQRLIGGGVELTNMYNGAGDLKRARLFNIAHSAPYFGGSAGKDYWSAVLSFEPSATSVDFQFKVTAICAK